MYELLKRIEMLESTGSLDEMTGWLGHDDWQVRRAAATAIAGRAARCPEPERDAIVRILLDGIASESNAGLRSASVEALSRLAPQIGPSLLAELATGDSDVRIMLAPIVGESGHPDAIPALARLALGDDTNVATAAVIGLGRSNRREAVAPLIGLLAGADPWMMFPAVESLGELGDPAAVEHLAGKLDDPLLHAPVLDALVGIGGDRGARVVADRLFAGGPLRPDLVNALVRIGSAPAVPALASRSRLAAVAAFRRAWDPTRFDEFARLAQAGASGSESAVEAIGWTQDPRALPLLLVALGRPATQASAAAGLTVLLDDPVIAAGVREYAGRVPPSVREELVRITAHAAPVEAADLCIPLLSSSDEATVLEAATLAMDVAERLGPDSVVDADRAATVLDRLIAAIGTGHHDAAVPIARLAGRLAVAARLDGRTVAGRAGELLASGRAPIRLAGAELVAAVCGMTAAARAVVAEALGDPDPFVRQRALEIASERDPAAFRDEIESAMSDEEPLIRRSAVAALATIADESASAHLRRATGDWHGLVAADAMVALAARDGGISSVSLIGASRSDRALLRCVAVECLARLADEAAQARVREIAESDPDFEVRRAAVAACQGHPDAGAVLLHGLVDSHKAVRHAAVRLARDLADQALADRLAAVADGDASRAVRGEALVALAACAPELALARVGAAVPVVRLAPYAIEALERIGGSDPERVRRYRDAEAPPRTAALIDALGLLDGR